MPITTPARPLRKKKKPTVWPRPTGLSPTSPGLKVGEVLNKPVRYGEICSDCPSEQLGLLAVHETCEGPKQIQLGKEFVDYCGRKSPEKKSYAQQIYDEMI